MAVLTIIHFYHLVTLFLHVLSLLGLLLFPSDLSRYRLNQDLGKIQDKPKISAKAKFWSNVFQTRSFALWLWTRRLLKGMGEKWQVILAYYSTSDSVCNAILKK
ncbi:unnamed protein product [Clavelina lepadiformis]|uniref:ATP synthase F0 subunit 8 n=1 Tax=Clavelina lepadiformis TaxID=159417 RepID=A0ABP0GRM7_CLALP